MRLSVEDVDELLKKYLLLLFFLRVTRENKGPLENVENKENL